MNTKRRGKWSRGYEENSVWEEKHITYSQEPRLETSQGSNWLYKRFIKNISTKKISKLNNPIYLGAKKVSEKIGVPLKNTKRKTNRASKISLKAQIRNLQQPSKVLRQIKKNENMFRRIEKNKTIRRKDTNQIDESEGIGERRNAKNISKRDQTIKTKKNFPKQRMKMLPASRERICKGIPAVGC